MPLERDEHVTPGQSDDLVIDHDEALLGVFIHYDAEYPEVARDIVDRGAEVIVLPSFTAIEVGF